MKRLLTAIFVLALIGASFYSCKKDETTHNPNNSITITGTFTIGDNTFTNPTFDLGEPTNHVGSYRIYTLPATVNGLEFYPKNDIDLGNNVTLSYENEIYSAATGTADMFAEFHFYLNGTLFTLYSETATAKVTKIDAVGGYIEGTYEGTFYEPTRKNQTSYSIKGSFKVEHIAEPAK